MIKINRIKKELDWFWSKTVDCDQVEKVCMSLGPQRNLSTLTASLFALHSNCQVLNHAGQRIFHDQRIDFISHP